MKSLEKLITATRESLAHRRIGESPEMPPGFPGRVMRQLDQRMNSTIVVWQRTSYVGLAVAALVTLVVGLGVAAESGSGVAAYWIEQSPEEPK